MPVILGWSEAGLNLSYFFPSGLSAQAVTGLPHPSLEDETCP